MDLEDTLVTRVSNLVVKGRGFKQFQECFRVMAKVLAAVTGAVRYFGKTPADAAQGWKHQMGEQATLAPLQGNC